MKDLVRFIAKILLFVSAIGIIASQFLPSMITSMVPNLQEKSFIGLGAAVLLWFLSYSKGKKKNIYGRV